MQHLNSYTIIYAFDMKNNRRKDLSGPIICKKQCGKQKAKHISICKQAYRDMSPSIMGAAHTVQTVAMEICMRLSPLCLSTE